MSARPILLDDSFVTALADTESDAHTSATAAYRVLLDGYTARTKRLFALSSTLATLPPELRRGVFAPVQTLWVSRQHRSAAKQVDASVPAHNALTFVMLSRERIRTVATLAHDDGGTDYDEFDIDVIDVITAEQSGRSDLDHES